MPEHHLILGGCGFIGRHVALKLCQAGHTVTLADRVRLAHPMPTEIAHRIEWRALELGTADWDQLIENANVIHHYAWTSIPASANANPGGDLLTNVGATIDLLDALRRRGDGRIVFSSSGGTVYGRLNSVPVAEDHPIAPINAYGGSKATAEIYLGLYRAMHDIDCRIARIANPFGAGQDLSRGLGAVTTFLHRALNNQSIDIWGTGEIVRDYIHIADVVACLVALATSPRHAEFIFNVGSGTGMSLNGIVDELETQLERLLTVTRTGGRSFDVPVSVLDIEKAKRVFGWSPQLTFSQGIALTVGDLQRDVKFSTLDCGVY